MHVKVCMVKAKKLCAWLGKVEIVVKQHCRLVTLLLSYEPLGSTRVKDLLSVISESESALRHASEGSGLLVNAQQDHKSIRSLVNR